MTSVRKVTFGVANSLDNYIARTDQSVDWIVWSKEVGPVMAAFWERIDTVVMGRKTYEVANRSHAGKGAIRSDIRTYVCSRTLDESSAASGSTISEDAVELVQTLKSQAGKDIFVMGGGELAKSLLEADLIDEVVVNIHPLLLGSGVSLFHEMERQIELELVESKVFESGCVYVRYRVKR